jgi:ribosomal protein S18 acetylase RimI-like enzyme
MAVDIQVSPALRGTDILEPQILDWAARSLGTTWHDGSAALLITSALETDSDRARLLRRSGFRRSKDSSLHLHLDVGQAVSVPALPPGYAIRSVAVHELQQRVALQAQVHSSGFSLDDYVRCRAAPGYVPALDLVAVAPDGTLAAFCICWLDVINHAALIEPLGVDSRFRRLGLGRAMVAEAIRRASGLGASSFRACTASSNLSAHRLYEALGFAISGVEVDYTRQCVG